MTFPSAPDVMPLVSKSRVTMCLPPSMAERVTEAGTRRRKEEPTVGVATTVGVVTSRTRHVTFAANTRTCMAVFVWMRLAICDSI